MKSIIKKSLQSLLLVPVFALGVSAALPVLQPDAVNAQSDTIRDGVQKTGTGDGANSGDTLQEIAQKVVNVLLLIIGAVSVIMIIWGGFKYITSGGDSSAVGSAKNTILYAVIGLVVALLSYAIINFVIDSVTGA